MVVQRLLLFSLCIRVWAGTTVSRILELFMSPEFWAPTRHPARCLVWILLILLCRARSKLDVQVVGWN